MHVSADRLVAALVEVLPADAVLVDDAALTAAGRDTAPLHAARPDVVVEPSSTAEVVAVVRTTAALDAPVTVRGAGSGLAGAAVPSRGGVVLSTRRMARVLEVSRPELLAVAQPGVVLTDLDAAADEHGLRYAPDPASSAWATLGGSAATSAGGLRGLKHGTTREAVLGLEVVLADGEVIRTGGRLRKDVAGYDLTRLLVGSEGTLGVITELIVALQPVPQTSSTGVAVFDDLEAASRAVTAVLAAGVVPATLEFLDHRSITAVEDAAHLGLDTTAGALLIFGDDGDASAVQRSLEQIAQVCAAGGGRDVVVAEGAAQAEDLLAARRCALPALQRLAPVADLGDVGVPRPHLAQAVHRIGEATRGRGLDVAVFGHAGDGNLHPVLCYDPSDDGAADAARATWGEVYRTALELGGTITGEHGVGLAKLPYLELQRGSAQTALYRRLKAAFDPGGLFPAGA
ncbi:glycolate oxidase [Quadrisphaera granulorum]|uniref:Glycolate oxidase n=1 Tax=Quadrisphaera granulorum TaxID=317664 RepID=A0A316A7N7_9ACTN|nr:FAD-linked oxidase C-terminal domain-containing protein [Quadrisphaera granulorum]PWJ53946.1 glycolate oxidase [Quadrisphaera granulorum]SZE96403.1 glycolate oxidase [Quadrisphaera granulorum]